MKRHSSFVLFFTLLHFGLPHSLPPFHRNLDATQILLNSALQTELTEELMARLKEIGIDDLLHNEFAHPLTSCSELSKPDPSGFYFVQNSSGFIHLEHCEFNANLRSGALMNVAHLDMTRPGERCPNGLVETSDSSAERHCVRDIDFEGCSSVIFPTHGHQYSQVCGRIEAIQSSNPAAFRPYIVRKPVTTLDDSYVDGISLTHGPVASRKHIWTFAAAYSDQWVGYMCSCESNPDPDLVPAFVGHDFFCETGSRTGDTSDLLFKDDPLWDGEGCKSDRTSKCCGFNNPPWFCKQLAEPTTDDIEMRLCLNEHEDYGNILVNKVDFLVQ